MKGHTKLYIPGSHPHSPAARAERPLSQMTGGKVPERPILRPVLVKPVSAPVIGPGKKWGSDQPDPRQRLVVGTQWGRSGSPRETLVLRTKGEWRPSRPKLQVASCSVG